MHIQSKKEKKKKKSHKSGECHKDVGIPIGTFTADNSFKKDI
jgi:hypothetical protein